MAQSWLTWTRLFRRLRLLWQLAGELELLMDLPTRPLPTAAAILTLTNPRVANPHLGVN